MAVSQRFLRAWESLGTFEKQAPGVEPVVMGQYTYSLLLRALLRLNVCEPLFRGIRREPSKSYVLFLLLDLDSSVLSLSLSLYF